MAANAISPAPGASGRWLYGPAADLLLGCGLLYLLVLAGFALAGPQIRAQLPLFVAPLLILAVSGPHYGATLLRVYEERSERHRYVIFALWATLLVAIAFVAGVYDPFVGSVLLTVYLTWSPWHYTGQNFGLAMMFLRRRQVPVSPRARRLLYGSFVCSYLMFFVSLHQSLAATATSSLGSEFLSGAVAFRPLGFQPDVAAQLFALAGMAYLGCLAGAGWQLSREAPLRDLAPAALLAFTQAFWFAIPVAARYAGLRTGIEPLDEANRIAFYVQLTAVAHAVQYLWVTSYFARESKGWRGYPHYLSKVLLAGTALWCVPVIVFGPDGLGAMSYRGGLALVLASAINIHHFILDGAIWKLRSSRIASVLVRSAPESEEEEAGPSAGSGWVRRVVWGTAVAGTAAGFFVFWQVQVVLPAASAQEDYHAASAALDRLAWLGRDDPERRRELAVYAAGNGGLEEALSQAQRSIDLTPTAAGYETLASVLEQGGRTDDAAAARARARGLQSEEASRAQRAGAYPTL